MEKVRTKWRPTTMRGGCAVMLATDDILNDGKSGMTQRLR